eukprot:scaffold89043_cov30-Tisochrysis_lutea.AAC.3
MPQAVPSPGTRHLFATQSPRAGAAHRLQRDWRVQSVSRAVGQGAPVSFRPRGAMPPDACRLASVIEFCGRRRNRDKG